MKSPDCCPQSHLDIAFTTRSLDLQTISGSSLASDRVKYTRDWANRMTPPKNLIIESEFPENWYLKPTNLGLALFNDCHEPVRIYDDNPPQIQGGLVVVDGVCLKWDGSNFTKVPYLDGIKVESLKIFTLNPKQEELFHLDRQQLAYEAVHIGIKQETKNPYPDLMFYLPHNGAFYTVNPNLRRDERGEVKVTNQNYVRLLAGVGVVGVMATAIVGCGEVQNTEPAVVQGTSTRTAIIVDNNENASPTATAQATLEATQTPTNSVRAYLESQGMDDQNRITAIESFVVSQAAYFEANKRRLTQEQIENFYRFLYNNFNAGSQSLADLSRIGLEFYENGDGDTYVVLNVLPGTAEEGTREADIDIQAGSKMIINADGSFVILTGNTIELSENVLGTTGTRYTRLAQDGVKEVLTDNFNWVRRVGPMSNIFVEPNALPETSTFFWNPNFYGQGKGGFENIPPIPDGIDQSQIIITITTDEIGIELVTFTQGTLVGTLTDNGWEVVDNSPFETLNPSEMTESIPYEILVFNAQGELLNIPQNELIYQRERATGNIYVYDQTGRLVATGIDSHTEGKGLEWSAVTFQTSHSDNPDISFGQFTLESTLDPRQGSFFVYPRGTTERVPLSSDEIRLWREYFESNPEAREIAIQNFENQRDLTEIQLLDNLFREVLLKYGVSEADLSNWSVTLRYGLEGTQFNPRGGWSRAFKIDETNKTLELRFHSSPLEREGVTGDGSTIIYLIQGLLDENELIPANETILIVGNIALNPNTNAMDGSDISLKIVRRP